MSFARSPATVALLRSLASSPQAASKTCFDCLVNPASCQISSIAAASSSSTFPAQGAVQTRWQSSCASSATSTSSTTAWSSASSSRLPARRTPLTSNPSSISKRNFSIQAAARKKNDVPVYTYDIPNLDDLLALEARNLNPLSEDVALESFELKLYQRRYTLLTDRVHKSFSKLQMLHLAKLAGVEKFSTSTSKAELIRLVLLAVWDLEAPVDIITRVNKKMAREKNQAEDVVANVAVSAKELFFLTPGTRVRGALLAQLVQQCEDVNVRLTNIYSPEPKTVLQFTGPGEQVEEAKVLWNKLKKNISNNTIDTHTKVPFKPYQLANLSDASGAYITPGKKDKGAIQLRVATIKKIAARQKPDSLPSASAVNIAARNIRFLAANNELMEKVPKYSYSDEAFGYESVGVYFPIILAPKDTPWYLRKLPVTALLRYTSQDNASRNKVLFAAGNVTTSMEQMEKQLLTPAEMLVNNSSRGNAVEIEVSTPGDTPSQTCEYHPSEQGTPSERELIVKFGYLLRVDPENTPEKQTSEAGARRADASDDVFVPAAHQGFSNRYSLNLRRYEMLHLNEHIKGLDVDKSTIRRVTYLTDKFEDYPVRMLQLERLERPEDMHGKGNKTETYWKGKHGYLNAAHIAMPYNLNDLRLEVTSTSEAAIPRTAEANWNLMPDKALPPNVKIDGVEFHLVEDYTVEETRFKSGIPEPFAAFKDVLEPVLVKREGFPIALELRSKDAEKALKALDHMLQNL